MDKYFIHRGIACSVKRASGSGWKWEVQPPASVKGLCTEGGEETEAVEAINAARRAVDRQVGLQ